jgi:hypothetical protein
MNVLKIEARPKTPYVHFDGESGRMVFRGMSCAENSPEFYRSILSWVENYALRPSPQTVIEMQFKYFNTSSAKCLLDVLNRFLRVREMGSLLVVNWFYEDDDEQMLEAGEHLSEIIGYPFQYTILQA